MPNRFDAAAWTTGQLVHTAEMRWDLAAIDTANRLAIRLRDRLRFLGAPQGLIDAIDVYRDERDVPYVGVPRDDPALQRELFDFEFGSLTEAPKAVLRNEANSGEFQSDLERSLLRYAGAV